MIERYFNHLTLYNKLDFKSYGYKYAIDLYENNQMKYSIIPMGDEIKIDGALYRVENKNTKSFDDICNIKK
ncbi:hypothetical protein lbkm_3850 [Lachnospiraceae bacterium KM106-2]|nr:hypothetical protein lbkm_3850 [Lachnospiraceae bacterium KM106-2]